MHGTRIVAVHIAVGCLLLAALAPATGHAACVHYGGTLSGAGIIPNFGGGTVTGDLNGAFAALIQTTTPNPDGTLTQTGTSAFVSTNPEDGLRLDFESLITPVAGSSSHISSTFTVRGGTGRFENASGTLGAIGEGDLRTGQQTFRFRAEICTPD